MLAALLETIGKPLALREVDVPRPADDEVLVRTESCGICRTDLHIQDGTAYTPQLPHILGHEPAGVVAAVGAQVRSLAVGTRVVPHLFVAGAPCDHVRAGRFTRARELRGIIGVSLPGGFAQYFTAPARNLLAIPASVPSDIAGLASCAAITAVHAWRRAGLAGGDAAVVVGAGGIGSLLIQLAVHAGVRVAALVRSPAEARHALAQHAQEALCVGVGVEADAGPAIAALRSWAGPGRDGVDGVFETVGRSGTMAAAASCLRADGVLVVIGEEPEHPAIDTIAIAQRELRILGSRNGTLGDAAEALELMASGVLRPPIQAHLPLSCVNQALELARSGTGQGRVVLLMN